MKTRNYEVDDHVVGCETYKELLEEFPFLERYYTISRGSNPVIWHEKKIWDDLKLNFDHVTMEGGPELLLNLIIDSKIKRIRKLEAIEEL